MKFKTVILGAGESGIGAALLASAKGLDPFVSDLNPIEEDHKQELKAQGIPYEENGHTLQTVLSADLIVKSPGIPETSEVVASAKQKNMQVIDELELAFRYTKAQMIAITGTNGKTTTTLLTYHLLQNAGLKVGLAGNIGHSLARQVISDQYDIYVVEASSFQIDGWQNFRARIAILLNITPDHLDRYNDDFSQYVNSKLRIGLNQEEEDTFIYWADDPVINKNLSGISPNPRRLPVSIQNPVNVGAFMSGKELQIRAHDKFSVDIGDLPLIGKHNMINTMSAILAALSVGVRKDKILNGLRSFKNAPHRLERIASIYEVEYINDSKATNVDAVLYALDGVLTPIIWIAGGIDKGNDYTMIDPLVREKVKALICLGVNNEPLTSFFRGKVNTIHETQDISEAVRTAHALAASGDTVLLSPACASFDLFKNYEHRGDRYREEVLKLKSENGHKKEAIA